VESGGQSPPCSAEEFLCARCARHQQTCCQHTDIVVTLGDLARIEAATGRSVPTEYRGPANAVYADQDDDPLWKRHLIRSDGTRRVLRQAANGDCTFLGPTGCTLPPEVRPLICRLYPFDYTADGLKVELARGCPLELLRPGETLLEVLDMRREQAERWHRQLYAEILQEPPCDGSAVAPSAASISELPLVAAEAFPGTPSRPATQTPAAAG
jgi:Fe-S-cluster containining protein